MKNFGFTLIILSLFTTSCYMPKPTKVRLVESQELLKQELEEGIRESLLIFRRELNNPKKLENFYVNLYRPTYESSQPVSLDTLVHLEEPFFVFYRNLLTVTRPNVEEVVSPEVWRATYQWIFSSQMEDKEFLVEILRYLSMKRRHEIVMVQRRGVKLEDKIKEYQIILSQVNKVERAGGLSAWMRKDLSTLFHKAFLYFYYQHLSHTPLYPGKKEFQNLIARLFEETYLVHEQDVPKNIDELRQRDRQHLEDSVKAFGLYLQTKE